MVRQVHQVKLRKDTLALKQVSALAQQHPPRLEVLRRHQHLAQALLLQRLSELLILPLQPLEVILIDPKRPVPGLPTPVSPTRLSTAILKAFTAVLATIPPPLLLAHHRPAQRRSLNPLHPAKSTIGRGLHGNRLSISLVLLPPYDRRLVGGRHRPEEGARRRLLQEL